MPQTQIYEKDLDRYSVRAFESVHSTWVCFLLHYSAQEIIQTIESILTDEKSGKQSDNCIMEIMEGHHTQHSSQPELTACQTNNNASVAQLNDDQTSSSEVVLKFSCSPGTDEPYEPNFVTRRKKSSSRNRPVRTNAIRQPFRRLESHHTNVMSVQLSNATYSLNDRTEVDGYTSSTTIHFGSEDESNSSAIVGYHSYDTNMSQNMPQCLPSSARPHCPCRGRHGVKTEGNRISLFRQTSTPEPTLSREGSDSEKSHMEMQQVPATCPSHVLLNSVNQPSKRTHQKDPLGGQCSICVKHTGQASNLDYSIVQPLKDDRTVVGLLDRVKAVEFSGTQQTSRLLLWPISRVSSPKSPAALTEFFSILAEQQGCMVYTLQCLCSVRAPKSTQIAVSEQYGPVHCMSAPSGFTRTNILDENAMDVANPNISSPIVDADLAYPLTLAADMGNSKIGQQLDSMVAKLPTPEPTIACKSDVTAISSKISEPASSVAVSRRKFRRRVKISLHQCPVPSELETSSLIVRLRIDPLSDSEAVLSPNTQLESVVDKRHVQVVQSDSTDVKCDTLEQRKVSSWVPINYMRSVDMRPYTNLDERDGFNRVAECLITSLSSLSIPISEVESIDTSFSWSFQEQKPKRQTSRCKAPSVPLDTVIVEVMSDDELGSENVAHPERSDSGMYYIGFASSPKSQQTMCDQLTPTPTPYRSPKTPQRASRENTRDLLDYEKPAIRYQIEKSRLVPKLVANPIHTGLAAHEMRASSAVNDRPFNVNEIIGDVSSERFSRNQGVSYPFCYPLEETGPDEQLSLTKTSATIEQSSCSITTPRIVHTQCVGEDDQSCLALEMHWKDSHSLQTRVSRKSQCDETTLKSVLVASGEHIADEQTVVGTEKLEAKSVKSKRIISPSLVWKRSAVSSTTNLKQKPRKSTDANKEPGLAVTTTRTATKPMFKKTILQGPFTAETHAKGLFQRKKPNFRSGEFTISECENLRQQMLITQSEKNKTRKGMEKATLSSVASELESGSRRSVSNLGLVDKQVKFNLCMPREHSSETSQEYVNLGPHWKSFKLSSARGDARKRTRFGFICMGPERATPDAWQSRRNELQLYWSTARKD
ncbi:hypothetical protein EG68_08103 [Paragonimus skrjabini miyazakii]|uniref:Uncharacterized protein n=1 Tax=Paragonimus skrjabini miyazakii TaxID=59628 RepID=A0A8S9YL38_9TREM|nr:hypothetical protein EG68_08103 [Paragonimus skrjabini miyazakii]